LVVVVVVVVVVVIFVVVVIVVFVIVVVLNECCQIQPHALTPCMCRRGPTESDCCEFCTATNIPITVRHHHPHHHHTGMLMIVTKTRVI